MRLIFFILLHWGINVKTTTMICMLKINLNLISIILGLFYTVYLTYERVF